MDAETQPLQEQINELKSKLEKIRQAATKWPRCCDLWQDSLGGMHCTPCSQKTFSMLRNIQRILGVNKACEKLE